MRILILTAAVFLARFAHADVVLNGGEARAVMQTVWGPAADAPGFQGAGRLTMNRMFTEKTDPLFDFSADLDHQTLAQFDQRSLVALWTQLEGAGLKVGVWAGGEPEFSYIQTDVECRASTCTFR